MTQPVLENGVSGKHRSGNVFLPLLQRAGSSSARELYEEHRTTRSAAQRALLLNSETPLIIDRTLSDVVRTNPPDWSLDTRHNLTVWTPASAQVTALVARVQERLREVVGDENGACMRFEILERDRSLTMCVVLRLRRVGRRVVHPARRAAHDGI